MPDSHDPLILIAGFGSIGRRHFRNLRSLGYEKFVFVRSRRGTLADDEIADYPAFEQIEDALALAPSIAVIANPSALHLPIALAAGRAGCALFIEKPVADTLAGCDELLALVREKQLTTMVGCQFRFHPLLASLRESLLAGRLGPIVGAAAEWGEYLPGWHPWEDHRTSYSSRKELGGGVVLTLIHPFDYLYWMFGLSRRVVGLTRAVGALGTPAGEDWADALIEFEPQGVLAHVHLDYLQRPPVHTLKVWGEQGRAALDFHAGQLQYEWVTGPPTLEQVPPDFDRNCMFLDEMRHFLDCCAKRQPSCIPLEQGIDVLKMALAARTNA